MRKIYFIILIMPFTIMAQTKSNVFIDGGANFYSTNSKSYVEPLFGFSAVHNFKSNSIGGSLELTMFDNYYQISSTNHGGSTTPSIALLADFRHYFNFEQGAVIPIFQIGYNFYSQDENIDSHNDVKTIGGIQWNIGLMYFIKAFKKGGGLTFQLKYENKSFKNTTTQYTAITSGRTGVGAFVPTIGLRL